VLGPFHPRGTDEIQANSPLGRLSHDHQLGDFLGECEDLFRTVSFARSRMRITPTKRAADTICRVVGLFRFLPLLGV